MGGQLGALGAGLRSPRLWRPPPGCRSPLRGVRGRCLSGWPPAAHGPRGGGEGGGRAGGEGGFPAVPPWSPGAAPRRPRGAGLVVLVPGGQPPTEGAHPAPAPLHPSGARPSCRPSLGPPALLAVAARCRLAGGGGEGRRVLGVAARVSGQRLAGCGAVGLPSRSLPRPLAHWRWRAPLRRAVRWGGVGWGARLRFGGASCGTVPSPPPRADHLGRMGAVVTCVVACVGAGAAAVAGSAGGSASW